MREAHVENLVLETEKFSFKKDFASASPQIQTLKNSSGESIRIAFSYFSDYGDPLMTDISYPDGLLQALAAKGVNGIWLHVVLHTLVEPDGVFQGSPDASKRRENLNKLIVRAKKYGIKVWLYFNEPRPMPLDFFTSSPERAKLKGAVINNIHAAAMCTSNKTVVDWLSKSVEKVFAASPDLGGVFTITASENLTNCLARHVDVECPVCKKRGAPEVVSEINNTILRSIKRVAPNAKLIFWDWGWKPENARETIKLIDKDAIFMTVSEIGLNINRGGVKSTVGEYSLSSVGPSERSRELWQFAAQNGHRVMAKVQAGLTWEFAATPTLPVLKLVGQHAQNLRQAGVSNYLLSWSLGGFPSENMELFNSYDSSISLEQNLYKLAEKNYGKSAAPSIVSAWNKFSDSFKEYPFHIATVYNGVHNMGVANPIYSKKTGYSATMVGLPYDDINSWRSVYPIDIYISQMDKVARGFEEGIKIFASADTSSMSQSQIAHFKQMLNWAKVAAIHFRSVANQAEFYSLRNSNSTNSMRISQILDSEKSLTLSLLNIVLGDSCIGFESSNHYFYTSIDLYEKLVSISHEEEVRNFAGAKFR